jgi:filamentous hemagglutinin
MLPYTGYAGAGALTASSGTVRITGGTSIAPGGAIRATGDITLSGSAALTNSGASLTSTAGSIALTSTASTVTISAALSAPVNVSLTAYTALSTSAAVTATGGTVTAESTTTSVNLGAATSGRFVEVLPNTTYVGSGALTASAGTVRITGGSSIDPTGAIQATSNVVLRGTGQITTATNATITSSGGLVEIESTGGLVTIGNDVAASLAAAGGGTRNIGILLKTTDRIRLQSSVDLTSSGSDIVLWADSDDNGVGPIFLAGTNLIRSNGGNIVMGGGLDNGGTGDLSGRASGDRVPDGYAKAVSGESFEGTNHAGIGFEGGYQLLSAGGNIELNGQGVVGGGVEYDHGVAVKGGLIYSDTGKIAIVGKGPNTCTANYHRGIFTGWVGDTYIVSNSTASDAIYMRGDTSACNNTSTVNASAIHGWSENTFIATPNGGGISLSGAQGNASHVNGWYTSDILLLSGYQLISNSGPIAINATKATTSTTKGVRFDDRYSQGISYLGALQSNHSTPYAAFPTIAAVASNSNVTINADSIYTGSTSFRTNGHILLQPNAASFDSAQVFDSTLSTTWPGKYASVTIGKPGSGGATQSSSDVSIDALSASGDIKIYGRNITLGGALSSDSSSGTGVLLKATGSISTLRSVTTQGSHAVFWTRAGSANSSTDEGELSMNNASSITTNGGKIIIAGSTDQDSDGLPNGDIYGNGGVTLSLGTASAAAIALTSGNGDIRIYSRAGASASIAGAFINNGTETVIDSGTGRADLRFTSSGTADNVFESWGPFTVRSNAVSSATLPAVIFRAVQTNASSTPTPIQQQGTYLHRFLALGGGDIAVSVTSARAASYAIDFARNFEFFASSGRIAVDLEQMELISSMRLRPTKLNLALVPVILQLQTSQ